MSRCIACNTILSRFELVDKSSAGEYYDLCTQCKVESGVMIVETVVDGEDVIEDFSVQYDFDDEQALIEELVGRIEEND